LEPTGANPSTIRKEAADARTDEKPRDRPMLVRERRARSHRRSYNERRVLLRELPGRLSTDRGATQRASSSRSRRRDRVRALPEGSRRVPEGIPITTGPQAQGRIVDQAGRRRLLRFAHVPRFRERALAVGIPNGVAGGLAAPGDARTHEVQAHGHRSSERRARLRGIFPQVHGEAPHRLDRDAAPSMSPRRRRPYSPECVEGQFSEVRAEGFSEVRQR